MRREQIVQARRRAQPREPLTGRTRSPFRPRRPRRNVDLIEEATGVDLMSLPTGAEVEAAIVFLDVLRDDAEHAAAQGEELEMKKA